MLFSWEHIFNTLIIFIPVLLSSKRSGQIRKVKKAKQCHLSHPYKTASARTHAHPQLQFSASRSSNESVRFAKIQIAHTHTAFLGVRFCQNLHTHLCYNKSDFLTCKSLSDAFIFASTNPQYDNRLFIELQVQYMKISSSNLGTACCVQKFFLTIFVHNMFSPCSA